MNSICKISNKTSQLGPTSKIISKMKGFFIVFTLASIIATLSADTIKPSAEVAAKIRQCKETTGVSNDVAKQVEQHIFNFNTLEGKCFIKCVCSVSGWCDDDLKIDTTDLESKTSIGKEKVNYNAYDWWFQY